MTITYTFDRATLKNKVPRVKRCERSGDAPEKREMQKLVKALKTVK